MIKGFVGCDIAARWFDLCMVVSGTPERQRFDNTSAGCEQARRWMFSFGADEFLLVFEPTGRYSELLAEYLYGRDNISVLQANPRKFRQFAKSLDPDTKSDEFDAEALARYAQERSDQCRPFQPRSAARKELADIRMYMRGLKKRKCMLQNQLKCGLRSEFVCKQLESELALVESQLKAAKRASREVIKSDPELARDCKLLQSIPGVGEETAILLLTVIDFRQLGTPRAAARFAGLTQRKFESGSSVRGRPRITKAGDPELRSGLFFPSISARTHEPTIAAFADRMTKHSKPWGVIRTAISRKLVVLAAALIRDQRMYEPRA
jgi:transposase